MSTALAIRQPQPADWQMIQLISEAARDSGALGNLKREAHAMKLLTAWENGLPLTSAFANVYIINNIPSLSPKAVWAKTVSHPEFAGYTEKRLEKAGKFHGYTITLKRSNGIEATRTFTLDDAKIAGLDSKDNWKMYPEQMTYWRAMGFAQDAVFPDVTVGVVRADALGATVSADGQVIDVPVTPVTPPRAVAVDNPTVAAPKVDPSSLLNDLVQRYGAERVMVAAEGKIPSTLEELEAVAAKLNGGES